MFSKVLGRTLLICGLIAVPAVLIASSETARNAAQKINLSARQATLLETMTQSACFTMTGLDAKTARAQAVEHMDSYDTVLEGLLDGHEWLGLLPESDAATQQQIHDTTHVWQNYRPVIQQIVHGDYHTFVVRQLIEDRKRVRDRSDALARHMMDAYGGQRLDDDTRRGLIAAATQQRRSQQVFTELCFVLFDIGGTEMVEQLSHTLAAFDQGFDDLMEGGAGLPKPPNARIGRNFRTAKLFWSKMRPIFETALAGEAVSDMDLKKALKFNKSVLKQLNQATEAYLQ